MVPGEDNTTNRLNSLRDELDGDKKGGREASAAAIAQAVRQLVHLAGWNVLQFCEARKLDHMLVSFDADDASAAIGEAAVM